MEALLLLYNILKSQLQTIENQRVPLNSVETQFSQMPDLLCDTYFALRAYDSLPHGTLVEKLQVANEMTEIPLEVTNEKTTKMQVIKHIVI